MELGDLSSWMVAIFISIINFEFPTSNFVDLVAIITFFSLVNAAESPKLCVRSRTSYETYYRKTRRHSARITYVTFVSPLDLVILNTRLLLSFLYIWQKPSTIYITVIRNWEFYSEIIWASIQRPIFFTLVTSYKTKMKYLHWYLVLH